MELRLTEDEYELLQQLLQEQYKHLLHEIAKADHQEFRTALRHRCTALESIMHKLDQPVHSAA